MPNSNRLSMDEINDLSAHLVAARITRIEAIKPLLPAGFGFVDLDAYTPRNDPPSRGEFKFLLQHCVRRLPKRYRVYPIANADCDALNENRLLGESDDLDAALRIAESAVEAFGAGIRDTETGEIDVGFGFGAKCADFNED